MQDQERFALIERTKIYADFMSFVTVDREFQGKNYMYICTKLSSDDDVEDWSGSI